MGFPTAIEQVNPTFCFHSTPVFCVGGLGAVSLRRENRHAGRGNGDDNPCSRFAVGEGAAVAFAASDKGAAFHARDLYVMVYDKASKYLAHGGDAKLIGKSLIGLRDTNGTYVIKDLVVVRDAGWISYRWPNPKTKMTKARLLM